MVRSVCLLAIFLLAVDARPNPEIYRASVDEVDWYIIGGSNAAVGAWPWQLSQQRSSGTTWSHSCGASLLNSRYALSASHCVDGAAASTVRVIAGLNDRTNTAGTQTSNINSYKMHESYNTGTGSYANDIAILTFTTQITIGGNVQAATLPPDNSNNFGGTTAIITGWGRTSSSNTLPNVLQQASVGVLTTAECTSRTSGIATITANHICIYDATNVSGACNGDSGGPVNSPYSGGHYVSGVASFVISSGGNCLPSYPSVYTRTSAYLGWIATNTP